MDRRTFRRPSLPVAGQVVRETLRELAQPRRRLGLPRVDGLLRPAGLGPEHKRISRCIAQKAYPRRGLGCACQSHITKHQMAMSVAGKRSAQECHTSVDLTARVRTSVGVEDDD